MPEITKADAIVAAAAQLAKVLQVEIPTNIGNHNTVLLIQSKHIPECSNKNNKPWSKQQSTTIQLDQE